MWNWMPVVIAAVASIVMLVRARGLRGDVSPLAPAFACAAGFGATLGARSVDLTGASAIAPFAGLLLAVPILLACVLVTFVRTESSSLESRPVPRLVHVVIGLVISAGIVLAVLQSRGRPRADSIPSACVVEDSAAVGHELLVHDRDVNVAGPVMDYDAASHNATACSLLIETRAASTKIALPPPEGYSGSYHCHATWVAVCSDARVILMKTDTGSIIDTTETRALALPDLTPIGVTPRSLGPRLAPPWQLLGLAAMGLVALGAGIIRRGATTPQGSLTAPYRAAAERVDPVSNRAPAEQAIRAPITLAIAVTLAMPLAATLVIQ